MPYCVVFNCNSRSGVDKNVHMFSFPKDQPRFRTWVHYCRRQDFTPSKHSKICSKHFTESQYSRLPSRLAELGYPGARPTLKDDAVPDIPVHIGEEQPSTSKNKTRPAFEKRRKREIIDEALDESDASFSNITEMETGNESHDYDYNTRAERIETGCNTDSPVLHTKQTQADLKFIAKQRTRRIQVDNTTFTKTVATQCNLLDAITKSQHTTDESTNSDFDEEMDDVEEDVCDHQDSDDPDYRFEDYEESETDSDSSVEDADEINSYRLEETDEPAEEKYYMVSESALYKLLALCRTCKGPCVPIIEYSRGTMIATSSSCRSCETVFSWQSQSCLDRLPWGNLLLASAIVISGNHTAKTLRMFDQMKLKGISERTARRLQSAYTIPSVIYEFDSQQVDLVNSLAGKEVVLGGDGRCDSPGYSAKYGSYSLMDLNSNNILDVQLVQSNEVKGSTHMELEGLKRGLRFLLDAQHLNVTTLVTDRHVMIKKYMRESHPNIIHNFDVWHIAKGITKKLEAAAKKKDTQEIRPWIKSVANHTYWVAASSGQNQELKIEKWKSITNHIANIHDHDSMLFPKCLHGSLEDGRAWLKQGSRPHKLVIGIVESQYLLRDLGKMSPVHQTYGLEVFHSVVNQYAPKSTHFFHYAMQARIYIAALHYNENGSRAQAKTKEGELKWKLSFPRAKKGEDCVVKPEKVEPTYEYVGTLLSKVFERRQMMSSIHEAIEDYKVICEAKAPLTAGYNNFEKAELVRKRASRFANN